MSEVLHEEVVIDNNVAGDNNDVNDNFIRYAASDGRAPLSPRQPPHRPARAGAAHGPRARRPGAVAARARARSRASATPRRAVTSPTARRCSTRWPKPASIASAPSCAAPSTAPARSSRRGCSATAAAYIRFATEDAELLELMFAGKHRQPNGPLQAGRRAAFSVHVRPDPAGPGGGALEPGDPERVGLVLFATIQGIAALVTGGMVSRRSARRARPGRDRALPARIASPGPSL